MSGHHKPLLSKQPFRTDPSSPIVCAPLCLYFRSYDLHGFAASENIQRASHCISNTLRVRMHLIWQSGSFHLSRWDGQQTGASLFFRYLIHFGMLSRDLIFSGRFFALTASLNHVWVKIKTHKRIQISDITTVHLKNCMGTLGDTLYISPHDMFNIQFWLLLTIAVVNLTAAQTRRAVLAPPTRADYQLHQVLPAIKRAKKIMGVRQGWIKLPGHINVCCMSSFPSYKKHIYNITVFLFYPCNLKGTCAVNSACQPSELTDESFLL